MGIFENQISYSRIKDEEALSETYINIAGAIIGQRLQQSWQDESYAAKTALEDVCKYYHFKPREIPETIKDINGQLDYAFGPCGIMRRNVKLKSGWRKNAVGAMLGVLKDSKMVVALIPGKMGGYTFRHPDTGNFVKVTAKNEHLIDDEAVVFYRSLPLRPINVRDIIQFMSTSLDFSDLFWYFAALTVITLLGLLTPKFTNILFSEVTLYGSTKLLLGVMIFMVCQTVCVQLLSAINALLQARISTKLGLSVESATVMRLFSMPTSFFKHYSAGELNQHVGYMNSLCGSLFSSVFSIGASGIFSLVYVAQIFYYSPALVLPAIMIILVTLAVSILTMLLNIKISKELMEIESKEKGLVYSIITGIQKIKLCGAEKRAFSRWGNAYAKEAKLTYSPPKLIRFSSVITLGIGAIGNIVLYYEAVKSNVTVADYYSFTTAYGYVSAAFSALAGIAITLANIKPVLAIIKPLLETQPEISADKEVVTRLSGSIELSHLSFTYPDSGMKVLNDISLKITPGQYVAIVGESGCGKTTLFRLLLGFETPQKGAVYYDGKNIDTLDLKSLRRKIGVVMQDSRLMWGDIYSNITVSAPHLTLDDAWEAAEIAGIADDIRAMPMEMNTVIQEGSGGISGGQRQRLMIARAVAPKPKILFLDEATSALDNITQKKVSSALDKMKCTRVVIAHRLSTIRGCDRILLLKNGVIAEDGSYDELIAKNGLFAELVKRQMIDSEKK